MHFTNWEVLKMMAPKLLVALLVCGLAIGALYLGSYVLGHLHVSWEG